MRVLKAELMKNKLLLILGISVTTALLQFLWINATFLSAGDQICTNGWMNLLSDLPMINVIVLPIYIAVIASIPAEIEHKGDMVKLLFTLQSRRTFFNTKLIFGFIICFIFTLIQTMLVFVTGAIHDFADTFPLKEILLYQTSSLLITYAIYLLHFYLSLRFRHQVVSLSLGICGSLFGTFLLFFDAPILYHLFLYSNYASLSLSLMSYDDINKICTYTRPSFDWYGILAGVCWLTLSYAFGRRATRTMI